MHWSLIWHDLAFLLAFVDNRLWSWRTTPLALLSELANVADSYLGVLICLCFIAGCWAGGFPIKGHMKAGCKGAVVRPACTDVWRGRERPRDRQVLSQPVWAGGPHPLSQAASGGTPDTPHWTVSIPGYKTVWCVSKRSLFDAWLVFALWVLNDSFVS